MTKPNDELPIYVDYSQKINSVIGTLSWQDTVCSLTKEFLDLVVRGFNNSEIPIRNILKFCESSIAFDQTQIKEYFIKNANASQILELGLGVRALNCTDLLTDYLTFIYEHKELDQFTKDNIENFVVHYAIQLWPHLEINNLTSWAIEGKFKNVLLNAVLYYPYHHMAMEEDLEEVLVQLLADKDWVTYAKVFVKFPGMIQEYNDEFQIKEVLADSSEKNHDAIRMWVTQIYNAAPMDTNLHLSIINLFNNALVPAYFMDMAKESLDVIEEMKMWNASELEISPPPTSEG